jgi:hypothetical protein
MLCILKTRCPARAEYGETRRRFAFKEFLGETNGGEASGSEADGNGAGGDKATPFSGTLKATLSNQDPLSRMHKSNNEVLAAVG